ncbi:MAG: PCMD domain-containing protein [Bacteroidales bacterium]|nr:PCMD domain-containing protein [Bacteroidales bacterium]MBR5862907.1 PCMD domain-containing protein [Bacteroidales bacterium]
MKRLIYVVALLLSLLACVSCVFENDMSYPQLQGRITAFAVEGQKSVTINDGTQTVEVLLQETAEINNLKVLDFELSELATTDDAPGQMINLSEPYNLLLKTYPGQEYVWTISASQPIERYIRCSGLIDAVFNADNQTVLVYVVEKQPLEEMTISAMKLGPDTSVIVSTTGQDNADSGIVTKEVSFPMVLDCTLSRTFTVLYKGVESDWTVTFVQKAIQNEIRSVVAWTYHAVVKGEYNGEGVPYFEYRKTSDQDWNRLDAVSVEGVSVTGDLTELEEATEYAVRLVSDNVVGAEYVFTTDTPAQLPGMGFNSWYYGGKNGKTWFPYAEDDPFPYWDTANPGISSLIENTTVPEYEHKVEGDAAARMVSSLALIKFAAGNLFTGKFVEFKDWTALLDWGAPFTSRPYSLKGFYDYLPAIVNRDEMGKYPDMVGKPDIMQIMVALVAEGEGDDVGPFVVNSNLPGEPNLKTNPRVIAYGDLLSDQSTGGEYQEFEIPLVYREGDTRTPAYVIIVACSSYRGDYFTGGVGSTLYVDGFSFTYR